VHHQGLQAQGLVTVKLSAIVRQAAAAWPPGPVKRTPLGPVQTVPFIPTKLMKEVLEMKGLLKMMVRTLRSIDMSLPSQRDWGKLRKTPVTDVPGPMGPGTY